MADSPRRQRLGLVGLLLVVTATAAHAQAPLPPRSDRSVHDQANLLAPEAVQTMEQLHTELLQKARVAIVVVTLPSLEGEPIRGFGVRLATEWGVGDADTDRGVVVVLALEERDIAVETGYGVEGFLPDGRVGAMLDEAGPLLSRGDYSAGLVLLSARLAEASAAEFGVVLEGVPTLTPTPRRRTQREGGPVPRVVGWLFMLGLGYLFLRHPRLALLLLLSRGGRRHGGFRGGGFGGSGGFGGGGFGGFGGGGFGGGGASRGF